MNHINVWVAVEPLGIPMTFAIGPTEDICWERLARYIGDDLDSLQKAGWTIRQAKLIIEVENNV